MTPPDRPAEPGPTEPRAGRRWWALPLVLAGHAWLACRLFPGWGAIVDRSSPVVMVDHAIHEAHCALGAGFLRRAGTSWGYDPAFLAGYPEAPAWDPSSNLAIAFDLLDGPGPGDDRAYKVGLPAASILGMIALAAGSAAAGLDPAEVAAAAGLAVLAFWGGLGAMFWRTGLFAFASASLGLPMVLGRLARFERRPTRAGWSIRTPSGAFMTADSAGFLLVSRTSETLEGRLASASMGLGSAGLIGRAGAGRGAAAATWGGATATLLDLVAFGSLRGPTRTLEPFRFLLPASLLLAIPAGSPLVAAGRTLARAVGGLAVVGWAWAEPGIARAVARADGEYRPLAIGTTPEMRALDGWIWAQTDLSGRILLEDQSRLLEATDPESTHRAPLLPELLGPDRWMSVGVPYQSAFIAHRRLASLGDRPAEASTDGDLDEYCRPDNIGRAIARSPVSRSRLDRWPGAARVAAIVRNATAGRRRERSEREYRALAGPLGPAAARRYLADGDGAHAIDRIDRPHTYVPKGRGRVVDAKPNRSELADVEPDGGAAVRGVAWLDTWAADPPLASRPEPIGRDPVPFVRFDADGALPRIILYNSYAIPGSPAGGRSASGVRSTEADR